MSNWWKVLRTSISGWLTVLKTKFRHKPAAQVELTPQERPFPTPDPSQTQDQTQPQAPTLTSNFQVQEIMASEETPKKPELVTFVADPFGIPNIDSAASEFLPDGELGDLPELPETELGEDSDLDMSPISI